MKSKQSDSSTLLNKEDSLFTSSSQNYGSISTLTDSESSSLGTASSLTPFNPVHLSWKNLNVFVPEKVARKGKTKPWVSVLSKWNEQKKKQVLFNVSGSVEPGQLVALMGARYGKLRFMFCVN